MEQSLEMKIARLANVEAHAAITMVIEIAAQLIDAKVMSAAAFSRETNAAAAALLTKAPDERQKEHAKLVQELIKRLTAALSSGERPTLH